MPVTKIKTKWSNGDLVFENLSATELCRIRNSGGFGHKVVIEDHTANDTLTEAESGSVHTNKGATGAITISLPSAPTEGTTFTFFVYAAQEFRIDPGDNDAIYASGITAADGKYVSADALGEYITLVANSAGDWIAVAINGTWTRET